MKTRVILTACLLFAYATAKVSSRSNAQLLEDVAYFFSTPKNTHANLYALTRKSILYMLRIWSNS